MVVVFQSKQRMSRRWLKRASGAIFLACVVAGPAADLRVTFLNPGSADDVGVWHMTSKFMQAAAEDLGIDLEIIYADRNHLKMIEQAELLAKRAIHPDYVLVVNEKMAGLRMLEALSNTTAKVLFIHNGLTDGQRKAIGNEREKLPNWIATVVTDEYAAGFALMDSLLRSKAGSPRIIGITGTRATPVSNLRLNGVQDCLKEAGRGEHLQVVHGSWSFADGKQKMEVLLKRYPRTDIVWAANDSMALGACAAIRDHGLENRIAVGGMGGFPLALESIKNGAMTVSVGGHPMIGAWALVLVCDYHARLDFTPEIGLNCKINDLAVIDTALKAETYSEVVLETPGQIDFRQFAKRFNPGMGHYDFSYENVLRHCGQELPRD